MSGDESPGLQSKLAAAHRAQREAERRAAAAEMQLAAAAAAAGRAAAAPAAEGRRLRAAQEASQAEADMLRSQLAAEQRGRGRQPREQEEARSPCERSGARRAGGGGLAAQLEDDADEARVQQLEERVIAAEAARAAIAARCKQLEQQLRQQPAQGGGGGRPGSAPAAGIGAAAEAEAQEVERLQEEKAALEAECSRLRQGATQSAEEIEPFSQQQLQQAGSPQRGSGTPTPQRSRSASPTKAGTLHRLAGSSGSPGPTQHPKQAERQQESGPAAKGGIGSPIEEPAGSLPDAAAAPQSSGKQQRPGSPGAASPHAQPPSPCSPARHVACSPSEADRQQFRREMQHTLRTAQRPGVVSRFPHSLGSFLALRGDLEVRGLGAASLLPLP